jgi:hypothetical protein
MGRTRGHRSSVTIHWLSGLVCVSLRRPLLKLPVVYGADAGASRTVEIPPVAQGDTCRTWRESAVPPS